MSQLYIREINVIRRADVAAINATKLTSMVFHQRGCGDSCELRVLSCRTFLLSLYVDRTRLNDSERNEASILLLFFRSAVDGQWSRWSAWSVCGSACTHTRRRLCDDPPPSHGGRSCQGRDINVANCTGGMCNGKSPANFSMSYDCAFRPSQSFYVL